MDELPVVTEWQTKIYCPNCKFYSTGQCLNPSRKNDTDACPLSNVEPIELQTEFKFKVNSTVLLKQHNITGKITNRKITSIGPLYEIEVFNDKFWVTEDQI